MFFKSKQKKLDPKVRFQHRSFTQKVKEAQVYKRQAAQVPETEGEKFLAGLGLDSWWSRIVVGLGIIGLVYLAYIPNFLFVKNINVSGAEESMQNGLRETIKQYFADSPFYTSQRNVVFLNTDDLADYILKHDQNVWQVHGIKKDLGTLAVQASFKRDRFLLVTPKGEFILYNDGTVVGPRGQINQNDLVRIMTDATSPVRIGEKYLSPQMLAAIELIQDNIERSANLPVDFYELPATTSAQVSEEDLETGPLSVLVPNELITHIKANETLKHIKPFKIYFDASSDIEKAIQNLTALITYMNPTQVLSLYYIDMRFPERGFSCAKQAPCAVEKVLIPAVSEEELEKEPVIETP